MLDKLAHYWKTIVAAAGLLAGIAQAIESANRWVAPALMAAVTVGVFFKRNKPRAA